MVLGAAKGKCTARLRPQCFNCGSVPSTRRTLEYWGEGEGSGKTKSPFSLGTQGCLFARAGLDGEALTISNDLLFFLSTVLPMTVTTAQLVPTAPRPLFPPTPIASTTTTSSLKPMLAPVGQPQPVCALGMAPAGPQQQHPPHPLTALGITPLGVQQPIGTLGISPMGPQQPANTLGVPTVGQQPPPPPANTLGPVPAGQPPGSAIGAGTVGGMMKPMNIHSAVPALPGYNFTATAGPVQQRLLLSPDMQARLPCEYREAGRGSGEDRRVASYA